MMVAKDIIELIGLNGPQSSSPVVEITNESCY